MKPQNLELVISDLDQTLLNKANTFSKKDFDTLKFLEEIAVKRVIATGRSLHSAQKVLAEDFPIDYLIFSSGAGIIDWQSKEIIYAKNLENQEINNITEILIQEQADFMLHEPIPDNHHFHYFHSGNDNPDFSRRFNTYKDFALPYDLEKGYQNEHACQFVIIIPPNLRRFESLKSLLANNENLHIIRATSPFDGTSIWIEVFPKGVSKGHSSQWLAEQLGISQKNTLGIGNDYNDLDLLNWTRFSYVVDNAPPELKNKYNVSKCHLNDGFSWAVHDVLKQYNT